MFLIRMPLGNSSTAVLQLLLTSQTLHDFFILFANELSLLQLVYFGLFVVILRLLLLVTVRFTFLLKDLDLDYKLLWIPQMLSCVSRQTQCVEYQLPMVF